jgi:UDP-N-acetylglucosamine enolpyruvyl transferase
VMIDILRLLGAKVERSGDAVIVHPQDISSTNVPAAHMRKMRSSILC